MTKFCNNKPVAQGDILIVPIDIIPATAKAATPENGEFIIAHSETGHHHVTDRKKAEVYEAADDAFIAYIRTLDDGAELVHKRDFHTHETIALAPNKTYRIHRQRQATPEGWQRVAD